MPIANNLLSHKAQLLLDGGNCFYHYCIFVFAIRVELVMVKWFELICALMFVGGGIRWIIKKEVEITIEGINYTFIASGFIAILLGIIVISIGVYALSLWS